MFGCTRMASIMKYHRRSSCGSGDFILKGRNSRNENRNKKKKKSIIDKRNMNKINER